MHQEDEASSTNPNDLTAMARCIYEALEINKPHQIPKAVHDKACQLLGSANKWALQMKGCTPEDNENYNKVARVVAHNLLAVGVKNPRRREIVHEIVPLLEEFELACHSSRRYNRNTLLRFFHSMSEMGEVQHYNQPTPSMNTRS